MKSNTTTKKNNKDEILPSTNDDTTPEHYRVRYFFKYAIFTLRSAARTAILAVYNVDNGDYKYVEQQ